MPRLRSLGLAAALTLGLGFATPSPAHALEAEYAPIVVKANDDTFLRFILWNQIWTRLIENNPGAPDDWTPDVGLRRVRFLAFGKIGDDVLLMFHFGINNQTFLQNDFGAGGPNFFVHDAWTEFKIVKSDAFRLDFGAGLIYWNGVSRIANASTLNFLGLDSPITTWPLINGSDQFARQLGLYVKGDIVGGLIDYRLALVKPFSNGRYGATPNDTFGLSSYVKVQIFDKESNTLPYAVGTYLGKKKVLNFGVGEHWQPNAGGPGATNSNGDIFLLGVDAFLDLPLGDKAEGGAVTAYALFQYSDYGKGDNVISTGIMPVVNTANGNVFNGGGNRYPLLGDGIVLYGQAGYLLPGEVGPVQIQPYVTFQANIYDGLADVAPVFEVGSNFYLEGHHAKFTLNYRARPVFITTEGVAQPGLDAFASEFILQTMIFL